MKNLRLHSLFSPASLGVLGEFSSPQSLEEQIVRNLETSQYQGKIFTLRIENEEHVLKGKKLLELPAKIDCALVCLELSLIEDVFLFLIEKGIRSIFVFPSGPRCKNREWIMLEEKLVRLAQDARVYFPGLNAWGISSPKEGFSLSLLSGDVPSGNVAFFGHSGTLALSLVEYAHMGGWGFSRLLSGSINSSVEAWQVVEFFQADPQTKVLLLHLERVQSGKYFIQACQDAVKEKPVILFKPASTPSGVKALAAYNGKVFSSEKAWKAAVDQAGIIRVSDPSVMADLAQAFACSSFLPRGNKVALVSTASFYQESAFRMLPSFSLQTVEKNICANLNEVAAGVSRLLASKEQSSLLLLLDLQGPSEEEINQLEAIAAQAKQARKTVLACVWSAEEGGEAQKILRENGIPCYEEISSALLVLQVLRDYFCKKEAPYPVEVSYRRDVSKAEQILEQALERNETNLAGVAAEPLLQSYELPQPKRQLARTSQNAVKIAKKMGFPVELRVLSPQLPQTGDWGGISPVLRESQEVRKYFQELTAHIMRQHRDVYLSGCMVQEASLGVFSATVRLQRDAQFGPLISLGSWSEFQNRENDAASCLAPLGLTEAKMMVKELFSVMRMKKEKLSFAMKSLEDVLLTFSRMALDCPQIYQAELQPVVISEQGVMIVDANFILYSRVR